MIVTSIITPRNQNRKCLKIHGNRIGVIKRMHGATVIQCTQFIHVNVWYIADVFILTIVK